MRLVLLLIAAAVAGCSAQTDSPSKRVRKPPALPSVVSTIELPGDDGRVHIVNVPGRYETSQCAVYVGPTGGQVACMPSVDIPIPEFER